MGPQSVKPPTLGFSSGHDPGVVNSSPTSVSVLTAGPAWDSLSLLSLSAPPPLAQSLCLSKINFKKNVLFRSHELMHTKSVSQVLAVGWERRGLVKWNMCVVSGIHIQDLSSICRAPVLPKGLSFHQPSKPSR